MSDIVERLNHFAGGGSGPINEVCAEAVEEIESLRAQITIAKNSNGFTLLAEDENKRLRAENDRLKANQVEIVNVGYRT